jgi:hypothetical protein
MITGNPMIRTKGERDLNDVTSNAISFRCWTDDEWLGPSNLLAPGVGEYDSVGLPTKFCPGGIRSNIFFPSYVLDRFIATRRSAPHLTGREF